jgi:site-specific DNA-methyltransferase (adenine-specific)
MTKAFAFILKKRNFDIHSESIICESNNKIYRRSANSFLKNPKSIINFQSDSVSAKIIEHVFSIPHITLSGRAKWGLGIVTGNNEKFSKSNPETGYIPVFRGADIKKNGLLSPNCYIPADLSLYQQVAPVELYQAEVKLIYRFISNDLCFYCDTEQRYVLNSANMLIPNANFPISATQLCALLNSDFLNWLFSELFRTHKILRSDLEALPIHFYYFHKHSSFDEQEFLKFLSIEKLNNETYRIKD